MAYTDKTRGMYQEILTGLKDAGLFKLERYIHSAQAADIEVEFPEGASDSMLEVLIEPDVNGS